MKNEEKTLQKHISPLGAWAFAIGTSVGWGSLVVTSSTYLAQSGPMGSVLGLMLGALIMLVISWNYAYLMRCYPDAGGAYSFTREVFGGDQGFLTAWFLTLTYLAILWANATSLPLFSRIFLGNVFRFGKLYTLFGYDVYLGEALLSVAALIVVGLLMSRRRRLVDILMIALALTFSCGIVACFIGALLGGGTMMQPAFVPDTAALHQIVKIAVISPWAFIGFESISHATEEFSFDRNGARRVLLVAVISTLMLYVLVTLLSVTAYPERYANWLEYIRDLDNLSGLEALPAFYAANRYMGGFGVGLLMLSLLSLVITSLIGNTAALSRLVFRLGRDQILPERYGRLNDRAIPENAIQLVIAFSCFIPLVGRTAIGWIVDVTTIGATLIYGFVSADAARMGRNMGDRREIWTGRAGMAIMTAFGLYILIPNLVAQGSMAKETYFLFIIWSVLGFAFFRNILQRDAERRYGKSIIVWVALLGLVLFVALVWMRQSMLATNEAMLSNIHTYYNQHLDNMRMMDRQFIEAQIMQAEREDTRTMLMAVAMFGFAMVIMITNHSYMNKRSNENERLANIDPMTGIKNKHAYLTRERELNEDLRRGTCKEFAIVVCDVNGLKKINDTYGHKAGDEYIREACRMVCEIFQHSPVYRVGGDEFVAILMGRDYAVRKELLLALHDRSVKHIGAGGAVVSGGMSVLRPADDTDVHLVFERADARMYDEKQLLKRLGAVTRDDETVPTQPAIIKEPEILHVRRRILVAASEMENQRLLGRALDGDYEVLYASDGVEALEQIHAHRDDLSLVLIDLQMPRMDGRQVLQIMKEEAKFQAIPVIVLTDDQNAELECLRIGAVDFIPKPCPAREIIQARVNKCVELFESKSTIQSTERDSLTRLFNIDYFIRYVRMYDQHYPDMAMDAVVIDIDDFRALNERYGKHYGDSVLARIGERVRHVAREIGGVGCRSGADTFMIYCPHCDDYDAMLQKVSAGITGAEAEANCVRLRMGE